MTAKPDGAEVAAPDTIVLRALASAVGVAAEQAERIDEQRRRQAWQRATTTITTLLLSGGDPQVVRTAVTGHAMQLDQAVAAAIIVPAEDPGLVRVTAGSGLLDPSTTVEFLPAEGAVARFVATRGTGTSATVVRDLAAVGERGAGPTSAGGAKADLPFGPAVAAALGADPGDGVLLVARGRAQQPFPAPDVDMVASYAAHAGLALALAETRHKRDLVRLVEDRERIATHLSERAMRALLEISTAVHGLTARMPSPDDARRLAEQVDRLDGVLREMQRAIFGLQTPPPGPHAGAAR